MQAFPLLHACDKLLACDTLGQRPASTVQKHGDKTYLWMTEMLCANIQLKQLSWLTSNSLSFIHVFALLRRTHFISQFQPAPQLQENDAQQDVCHLSFPII